MQLTSAPQLYPELIRLGAVDSILSLLSHENIDIVLSGIELLNEMTDEEIVPEEDGEAEEEGVQALVKALLAAQALELVVQNLSRLDESKEDERKGVFNVLGRSPFPRLKRKGEFITVKSSCFCAISQASSKISLPSTALRPRQ